MSLVGASSRRRGEGTKKRRFESSLLYEITSCSSVGDEVGSKDVVGFSEFVLGVEDEGADSSIMHAYSSPNNPYCFLLPKLTPFPLLMSWLSYFTLQDP